MQTVKRLTEDNIRKIIADHFKVKEDKVDFDRDDWRDEWVCEVVVE